MYINVIEKWLKSYTFVEPCRWPLNLLAAPRTHRLGADYFEWILGCRLGSRFCRKCDRILFLDMGFACGSPRARPFWRFFKNHAVFVPKPSLGYAEIVLLSGCTSWHPIFAKAASRSKIIAMWKCLRDAEALQGVRCLPSQISCSVPKCQSNWIGWLSSATKCSFGHTKDGSRQRDSQGMGAQLCCLWRRFQPPCCSMIAGEYIGLYGYTIQ